MSRGVIIAVVVELVEEVWCERREGRLGRKGMSWRESMLPEKPRW